MITEETVLKYTSDRFTGRRKILKKLIGLSLLHPLVACEKGELFMKKEIVLSVVLYSYLARPIFDIYLNRIDLGVANSYGGTGIVSGVTIPIGPQTLTWRLGGPEGMARNGEIDSIKNSLMLTHEQIQVDTRYLGVHIYPDNTAELSFSEHIPDTTPRGDDILDKVKKMDDKKTALKIL